MEIGDYTINHIEGCSHGCTYPCYAMRMSKRFGRVSTYEEWCEPKIVGNALELLDREIPKLKGRITSVHLCFMSDPFMYRYPEISALSLQIIRKLNAKGIKVTTLTKGVCPRELSNSAVYSDENEYGITLVSLDRAFRQKYEPYTAGYEERIEGLKRLSDAGATTWVCIEPYPPPNIVRQSLRSILTKVAFTDRIVFGRLNYNARVSEYRDHKAFYNSCTEEVIEFCAKRGIAYYIKRGTCAESAKSAKERETARR